MALRIRLSGSPYTLLTHVEQFMLHLMILQTLEVADGHGHRFRTQTVLEKEPIPL